MSIDLQAQVLRDGRPLTAPTYWSGGLKSFEQGETATWKLFPGAANNGEVVVVTVHHAGHPYPHWASVHAMIAVDGIPWPEPLPGLLYVGGTPFLSGVPCVIAYPIMSEHANLNGLHTLLIRSIIRED
jgi:hypothetical protein